MLILPAQAFAYSAMRVCILSDQATMEQMTAMPDDAMAMADCHAPDQPHHPSDQHECKFCAACALATALPIGFADGVPVVPIQARRGEGLDALKDAVERAGAAPPPPVPEVFPEPFRNEVDRLAEALNGKRLPRYLVERLLLDVGSNVEDRIGLAERLRISYLPFVPTTQVSKVLQLAA